MVNNKNNYSFKILVVLTIFMAVFITCTNHLIRYLLKIKRTNNDIALNVPELSIKRNNVLYIIYILASVLSRHRRVNPEICFIRDRISKHMEVGFLCRPHVHTKKNSKGMIFGSCLSQNTLHYIFLFQTNVFHSRQN